MRGDESMNPFWAVKRWTQGFLDTHNFQEKSNIKFNMTIETKQYQVVTVGLLGDVNMNLLTLVDVPLLVNPDRLDKGSELILEIEGIKKAEKRKAPDAKTWQDAVKMRGAAKAKPAGKQKTTTESGSPQGLMCDAEEI